MQLPFQPPIAPMLAKLSHQLPDGDGWIFEPKWDGFRALVWKSGDELLLQSRDLKPLGRYFPELEVTLRKSRMYDFVDRLVNIALPRVRDFRGLNPKSFDGRGNYSLGIKEHIIFPEIDFDKVSEARGMDITVCTTAKTDDEARALLTAFNFPFRQ